MLLINLLIKWRKLALPLAAGVALMVFVLVVYQKGYNACAAKFKAQAQERTIEDHEKLDELRSTRVNGVYVNRLSNGEF